MHYSSALSHDSEMSAYYWFVTTCCAKLNTIFMNRLNIIFWLPIV